MNLIESKQIAGTISENIKHFEVDGNTVKAIFWNSQQAKEYANKFFTFSNGVGCLHMTLGFANFTYDFKSNEIIAHSNYHCSTTMINMFENGAY